MASLAALPQTAETLLGLFVTQLEAQGVDLPSRRYVSNGPMLVADGEELTLSLQSITRGMPGVVLGFSQDPHVVTFFATWALFLVRKAPVIQTRPRGAQIPSAKSINNFGQQAMADVAALVQAAQQIHMQYRLTAPEEGFAIGAASTLEPAGGLAGVRLLLETTVD